MEKQGYVYIMANRYNTTVYIGVTNNLRRRVAEHKLHLNKGFSNKYNTEKLVYFETHELISDAIVREKQLKEWKREWKNNLIAATNPTWEDLSDSVGIDKQYMQGVKEAFDEDRLW